MKTKKSIIIAALTLLLPAVTFAHPGHHHEPGLFENLQHSLLTLSSFAGVLILLTGFVLWLMKKRKPEKIRVRSNK